MSQHISALVHCHCCHHICSNMSLTQLIVVAVTSSAPICIYIGSLLLFPPHLFQHVCTLVHHCPFHLICPNMPLHWFIVITDDTHYIWGKYSLTVTAHLQISCVIVSSKVPAIDVIVHTTKPLTRAEWCWQGCTKTRCPEDLVVAAPIVGACQSKVRLVGEGHWMGMLGRNNGDEGSPLRISSRNQRWTDNEMVPLSLGHPLGGHVPDRTCPGGQSCPLLAGQGTWLWMGKPTMRTISTENAFWPKQSIID